MKSEKVYFFIIRYLKIVKKWHERTSFFQVMEKKWEKKERKDIKKIQWMNLFIMMVEEQNMSKEIYK